MWVKICGLRDVNTAVEVAGAGADAIGLNFYPKSKRCVDLRTARAIVAELDGRCEPVGLFVNASLDEIRETVDACGLRTIQLHGDEPAEWVGLLNRWSDNLRVIRAIRVGHDRLVEVAKELQQIEAAGGHLFGCLVDRFVSGSYGGTGEQVPWSMLHDQWQTESWPPLILAGGLTPENVALAVETSGAWGVDVASGVESAPAIKDQGLVSRFIQQARAAVPG